MTDSGWLCSAYLFATSFAALVAHRLIPAHCQIQTREKYNLKEKLLRQTQMETTCDDRNANLLLAGTVWLERSHGMICGAGLVRPQLYPVCEMGEAAGGNQCRGGTWGQHRGDLCPGLDRPEGTGNTRVMSGGLRATCALGWWTGRGRALGTCSVVSWDPCGEQGRIRTNNARNGTRGR